jgi:hypothetical protein
MEWLFAIAVLLVMLSLAVIAVTVWLDRRG